MSGSRLPPNTEACTYTDYTRGDADLSELDLPATGEGATGVEADVWAALYGVDDPEMPVSIVDLGLIYGVNVEEDEDGTVWATVDMTLTYTGCPARNMLLDEVEAAVGAVEGVDEPELRLVWTPEWGVEMVTEAGKEKLREFGLSID